MSFGFRVIDLNKKPADIVVSAGPPSEPLFANTGATMLLAVISGYTSGPIGAGDSSLPLLPSTRIINPTAGPGPNPAILNAGGFYPNTGDPGRAAMSMLYAGTGFTGAVEFRVDLRDVLNSPIQFSLARNDVSIADSAVTAPVSGSRSVAIGSTTLWIDNGDDLSIHVGSTSDAPTGSYGAYSWMMTVVPQ